MLAKPFQAYLPATFYEGDNAAIDALLFFDRLAQKSDIIVRHVTETHGIEETLAGAVPEGFVNICEVSWLFSR